MPRRCYQTVMSQELRAEILYVRGHYEAFVNGKFVVSGDTLNEVRNELEEIGGTLYEHYQMV